MVLVMGTSSGGATRWINLGFLSFQPSEAAKIGLIIFYSALLTNNKEKLGKLKEGFLYPIFYLLPIMAILVVVQNHLSATLLITMIIAVMMIMAGSKIKYFLTFGTAGLTAGGIGLFAYAKATGNGLFRFKRLVTFLDPFADTQGSGWQIIQSLYAIGSGGFFGVGLGESKQKYLYLPEPHNDFIFAILAYSVINLIVFSYYTSSNQILIPEPAENISSVARDAGLLSGDKILFINDIEITCFEDISKEIMIRPDEDIVVIVDRNGETLTFNMHTDMNKDEGSGKIGISNDPSTYIIKETPKYNFFTAIGAGVKEAFDNLKLTFKSLGILFKGINIKNAVSGPLRVTDLLGSTVTESFAGSFKIGVINSLQLLAIISISLFIMNLLPIPVLDGGIILFAIIECITRKKIKPKIQYYIQFIGVAFIIVIFCVGLFGDISYLINK